VTEGCHRLASKVWPKVGSADHPPTATFAAGEETSASFANRVRGLPPASELGEGSELVQLAGDSRSVELGTGFSRRRLLWPRCGRPCSGDRVRKDMYISASNARARTRTATERASVRRHLRVRSQERIDYPKLDVDPCSAPPTKDVVPDLIDLDVVSDSGSLFEYSPGRVVPDWLEHLLQQ
jgi:hypothetical protein